jgi:hypothetical protein
MAVRLDLTRVPLVPTAPARLKNLRVLDRHDRPRPPAIDARCHAASLVARGIVAPFFAFSTFDRLRPASLLTNAWTGTNGRAAGLI